MAFLTREQFAEQARASAPLQSVEVPGIGTVAVLSMTGSDLDEHYSEREQEHDDVSTLRMLRKWIARLVCDGDRAPLFTGPDDEALQVMPAAALLEFGISVIRASAGTDREEEEPGK